MKLLIGLVASLILASSAAAADPQITHQGRLLDSVGAPVTGTRTIRIDLFDAPSGPTSRWGAGFETPVQQGYYSVRLGPDPALTAALQAYPDLWLQVSLDNAPLLPREYLGSVPRAANAGGTGGLQWGVARADFGTGFVGSSQTLTLSNTSGVDAAGLELAATDSFTVSATTCGVTLTAGSSCTVDVTFVGPSLGSRAAIAVATSTSVASATTILSGTFSAPLLGSGADGALTISSTFDPTQQVGGSGRSGFADAIAYAVSAVSSGDITLENPPDGIAAGDKILLMMAQADNSTDVGNYDILDVSGRIGSILTLSGGVDPTRYDTGGNRKIIAQRIPQYSSVTINSGGTITAAAWDGLASAPSGVAGEKTGIVAFFATGSITNNGTITTSERGYRGGPDNNNSYTNGHGFYGEGITGGYSLRATWQNNPTNGGGGGGWVSTTGCCHGNGGGGGAYGSAGGTGSIDGLNRVGAPSNGTLTPGGVPYGASDLARLYPGGGGGSGGGYSGTGTSCAASDPECNKGGAGGGIVFLRADTLQNSGTIAANGQVGWPQPGTSGCTAKATSNTQDGSGGAGAGGSILLQASTLLDTTGGAVTANGGSQGCRTGYNSNNNDRERGGAGGVGRIRFEAPSTSGTASPAASTGTF